MRGRAPSLLRQAVIELFPGTGVKTSCKWRHPSGHCSGTELARKAAKGMGFKIIGRCRYGEVWVYRPE